LGIVGISNKHPKKGSELGHAFLRPRLTFVTAAMAMANGTPSWGGTPHHGIFSEKPFGKPINHLDDSMITWALAMTGWKPPCFVGALIDSVSSWILVAYTTGPSSVNTGFKSRRTAQRLSKKDLQKSRFLYLFFMNYKLVRDSTTFKMVDISLIYLGMGQNPIPL